MSWLSLWDAKLDLSLGSIASLTNDVSSRKNLKPKILTSHEARKFLYSQSAAHTKSIFYLEMLKARPDCSYSSQDTAIYTDSPTLRYKKNPTIRTHSFPARWLADDDIINDMGMVPRPPSQR